MGFLPPFSPLKFYLWLPQKPDRLSENVNWWYSSQVGGLKWKRMIIKWKEGRIWNSPWEAKRFFLSCFFFINRKLQKQTRWKHKNLKNCCWFSLTLKVGHRLLSSGFSSGPARALCSGERCDVQSQSSVTEFTVRVTRYFTPVSYSALMHTENPGYSEPSTRDKSYPTSFILIYTSAAIYFFFIFHTSMLRPLWFTAGLAQINSKVAPQTQLIKVVVWQRRRPFTLANDLSRSALWVLCFPVETYRSKMCLFFLTASMPLMLT